MDVQDDLTVQQLTDCRLKGKWVPLVAYLLRDGQPQRYAELKRQIPGISQKMLTHTLRRLEFEGIVVRTLPPTVPPAVEYAGQGKQAIDPLLAVARTLRSGTLTDK